MIAPPFVIKNSLPVQLNVKVDTPAAKASKIVTAIGRNQVTSLVTTEPCLSHYISLRLNPELSFSNPVPVLGNAVDKSTKREVKV